jgi:hypothetical protein
MFKQSFQRATSATAVGLLLAVTFVGAQNPEDSLKITRRQTAKQYNRTTPRAEMTRDSAFHRINPGPAALSTRQARKGRRLSADRVRAQSGILHSASALTPQGFGTGGGDVNEIEPNDRVAQSVSLPVNLFGGIDFDGDLDFFAFQALAGQQITVEAFAVRLPDSNLIADIALFDSSGRLVASDRGDEDTDPVVRFVPASDEVLVAGIADVEDFGGRSFDYVLNITRGVDFDEDEPNDRTPQNIFGLPATVFGDIDGRGDVDFYSFNGEAGQTLIVDIDAEALGSRLDAEVNLTDPETGVEYFYNDQQDGDDPRFNIVLPFTGRYRIGVGAFESDSAGFYRLNMSLVTGEGAPVITSIRRVSKKFIEVTGSQLSSASVVEVRGRERRTTLVESGTLRAKVKARPGDVVTVINGPDDRRSNPLILQ